MRLKRQDDTPPLLVLDQCDSANFDVRPAPASRVSLIVHPSRVRVADPNAISAVAFVFDRVHNLILSSQPLSLK